MTDTFRFPNESDEYRAARNALLEAEIELREQIERVAALRRALPLGGRLKSDYVFQRLDREGNRQNVPFADLFGPHKTLILYSLMFGPDWDAPCPSCTNIVDAMNAASLAVEEQAAIAVVSAATAGQLADWQNRRRWRLPVVSGAGSDYLTAYAGFPTDDPALVSAMNVFCMKDDGIYHFWNSELVSRPMANGHPRHVDSVWPLWNLLDLTPEGRGDLLVPRQDFEHHWFDEHVL